MQDQDTSARFSRSMPYYSEAQHVFARALTDYRGDLSKLDLVLYSIRRSSQGPESGPKYIDTQRFPLRSLGAPSLVLRQTLIVPRISTFPTERQCPRSLLLRFDLTI